MPIGAGLAVTTLVGYLDNTFDIKKNAKKGMNNLIQGASDFISGMKGWFD